MARVTVEDCIEVINNRYELVLLAAQRARDIAAGAALSVERDNDKNTVVSLREIAEQSINLDELRRHIARGVNRKSDLTVEDDELLALTLKGLPSVDIESVFGKAEMSEISFEDDTAPTAEAAEDEGEEIDTADDVDAMSPGEVESEMAELASLGEEGDADTDADLKLGTDE